MTWESSAPTVWGLEVATGRFRGGSSRRSGLGQRPAAALHSQLGERQTQILIEVIKAYPAGVGTGPICRGINYEQPNTYLALEALSRQGLVRKDDTTRPHTYYVGDALIRQMRDWRSQ